MGDPGQLARSGPWGRGTSAGRANVDVEMISPQRRRRQSEHLAAGTTSRRGTSSEVRVSSRVKQQTGVQGLISQKHAARLESATQSRFGSRRPLGPCRRGDAHTKQAVVHDRLSLSASAERANPGSGSARGWCCFGCVTLDSARGTRSVKHNGRALGVCWGFAEGARQDVYFRLGRGAGGGPAF
jgi:ribosomal protein S28E/S33